MSDTELLDKPKTEPVRRLEVFTGAGRRRSWTSASRRRLQIAVASTAPRHSEKGAKLLPLGGWVAALRLFSRRSCALRNSSRRSFSNSDVIKVAATCAIDAQEAREAINEPQARVREKRAGPISSTVVV